MNDDVTNQLNGMQERLDELDQRMRVARGGLTPLEQAERTRLIVDLYNEKMGLRY